MDSMPIIHPLFCHVYSFGSRAQLASLSHNESPEWIPRSFRADGQKCTAHHWISHVVDVAGTEKKTMVLMLTVSKREKQIWNTGKIQSKEYTWTKGILEDSKWPYPCSVRNKICSFNNTKKNILLIKTYFTYFKKVVREKQFADFNQPLTVKKCAKKKHIKNAMHQSTYDI